MFNNTRHKTRIDLEVSPKYKFYHGFDVQFVLFRGQVDLQIPRQELLQVGSVLPNSMSKYLIDGFKDKLDKSSLAEGIEGLLPEFLLLWIEVVIAPQYLLEGVVIYRWEFSFILFHHRLDAEHETVLTWGEDDVVEGRGDRVPVLNT